MASVLDEKFAVFYYRVFWIGEILKTILLLKSTTTDMYVLAHINNKVKHIKQNSTKTIPYYSFVNNKVKIRRP